jgi:hypothetical protein
MLKDVSDALKLVAEGIKNIRSIAVAIKDGKEYISRRHPDIKADVAAMCAEMRKTMQAVAAASAIITHFRFTVESEALQSEPARFNEHLMAHKLQARDVEQQLESMRGHCHVIRNHAARLADAAGKLNLLSMFKLFGLDSQTREDELRASLEQIYDDELQVHSNVQRMSHAIGAALNDIQQALGPAGTMSPANVPKAARTLGEYALAFGRLETECNYTALELQRMVDDLTGNSRQRAQ